MATKANSSSGKSKMYVSQYTCDVCNSKLLTDGFGLESFYCTKEHYQRFCKDHTKAITQYINTLILTRPK